MMDEGCKGRGMCVRERRKIENGKREDREREREREMIEINNKTRVDRTKRGKEANYC